MSFYSRDSLENPSQYPPSLDGSTTLAKDKGDDASIRSHNTIPSQTSATRRSNMISVSLSDMVNQQGFGDNNHKFSDDDDDDEEEDSESNDNDDSDQGKDDEIESQLTMPTLPSQQYATRSPSLSPQPASVALRSTAVYAPITSASSVNTNSSNPVPSTVQSYSSTPYPTTTITNGSIGLSVEEIIYSKNDGVDQTSSYHPHPVEQRIRLDIDDALSLKSGGYSQVSEAVSNSQPKDPLNTTGSSKLPPPHSPDAGSAHAVHSMTSNRNILTLSSPYGGANSYASQGSVFNFNSYASITTVNTAHNRVSNLTNSDSPTSPLSPPTPIAGMNREQLVGDQDSHFSRMTHITEEESHRDGAQPNQVIEKIGNNIIIINDHNEEMMHPSELATSLNHASHNINEASNNTHNSLSYSNSQPTGGTGPGGATNPPLSLRSAASSDNISIKSAHTTTNLSEISMNPSEYMTSNGGNNPNKTVEYKRELMKLLNKSKGTAYEQSLRKFVEKKLKEMTKDHEDYQNEKYQVQFQQQQLLQQQQQQQQQLQYGQFRRSNSASRAVKANTSNIAVSDGLGSAPQTPTGFSRSQSYGSNSFAGTSSKGIVATNPAVIAQTQDKIDLLSLSSSKYDKPRGAASTINAAPSLAGAYDLMSINQLLHSGDPEKDRIEKLEKAKERIEEMAKPLDRNKYKVSTHKYLKISCFETDFNDFFSNFIDIAGPTRSIRTCDN